MPGEKRRESLYSLLCQSNEPISGTELAKEFNVSRQVIVQDIALLRAKYEGIEASNKGYIIHKPSFSRVYYVYHLQDSTEEELNTIVDLGGCVENVAVDHLAYGSIEVKLQLHSRKDVQDFLQNMKVNNCKLLTDLTQGHHRHLVSAPNVEVLDNIESALQKMNILEHVQ